MTPDEAPAETISWQLCYALHVTHDTRDGRVNQTQTSMPLDSFPIGRFHHTLQILI
jgi:hypothetical protein